MDTITKEQIADSNKFWIIGLVLIGFAAHFILIFNTSLYQDGVIIQHFIDIGDLPSLVEWFVESSYHFGALMHYVLGKLPMPISAHRLLSFFSILTIGISVFKLFVENLKFEKRLGFYLASITMVFSSYKMAISVIHTHHVLCIALFYFSWHLYLSAVQQNKSIRFRVFSLALMFLSFSYNSILVLHLGMVFFYYLRNNKLEVREIFSKKLIDYALANKFLLAMPFIFFVLRKSLVAPVGRMAGYNQFALNRNIINSSLVVWHHLSLHFNQIIILGNWEAIKVIFTTLLPFILFVATLIICWLFRKKITEKNIFQNLSLSMCVFYFIGFFAVTAGPYGLVGKGATLYTWSERQAFLMGITLAFSVLLLCKIIAKLVKNHWIAEVVFIVLILGHTCRTIQDYLYLEAQGAKSASFIYKLSIMTPPPKGTAFFFKDLTQLKIDHYHWYELNKFFNNAWGGEYWIAILDEEQRISRLENYKNKIIDKKNLDYADYLKLFVARDFKPNFCFMNLEIKSAANRGLAQTGFDYFVSRIFDTADRQRLLEDLVSLNFYGKECLSNEGH